MEGMNSLSRQAKREACRPAVYPTKQRNEPMNKYEVFGTSKTPNGQAEPFAVRIIAESPDEAIQAVKDSLTLHNRELVQVVRVDLLT